MEGLKTDWASHIEECFKIFSQAIMASAKVRKHSVVSDECPLFKHCYVLLQFLYARLN